MGKTYFSLSDNLNFNGKTIKIKANSTEPPIKEEKKGRAYFNADFQSRIYQSILASQPQLVQVKSDSIIRMETDLRFLNSSAQNSSPNANIAADVMQVLDPRNPTIYEFCTYNLDTTANVKIIGVTGTYVLPVTIDPMYNHKKERTTYNTPVADRLFRLQGDGCYYYQYQEASPLLSIALGIKTYTIKLQVTNGNALLAVQEYNGNLTNQVTYMNDVNKLAYQGGFKNADFYP
jgi:hypothetical protein